MDGDDLFVVFFGELLLTFSEEPESMLQRRVFRFLIGVSVISNGLYLPSSPSLWE